MTVVLEPTRTRDLERELEELKRVTVRYQVEALRQLIEKDLEIFRLRQLVEDLRQVAAGRPAAEDLARRMIEGVGL